jgi:hypothetical protein
MKPGTTTTSASTAAATRAANVPLSAAAAENVTLSGNMYGQLRHTPGEDGACDGDDAKQPGAAVSLAHERTIAPIPHKTLR